MAALQRPKAQASTLCLDNTLVQASASKRKCKQVHKCKQANAHYKQAKGASPLHPAKMPMTQKRGALVRTAPVPLCMGVHAQCPSGRGDPHACT